MTNTFTKQSKDLTNSKTFEPTPHMIVWLDTAIRTGSDVKDEIARESKITEQSWYNWLKQPGFEDWYYNEYKRRRRRWLPTLDAIGMKQAKRGSYQHWEAMNKKIGELNDDKPMVAIQNNMSVSFVEDEIQTTQRTDRSSE